MIELGQLEAHHADFDKRNTRIVVSSVEGPELAAQTQRDFPHLVVLSDHERRLSNAVEVIHQHSAPDGGDTSAPTTILLDRQGQVRWLFRPDRVLERLSPEQLATAVDQHLPAQP
jgi:peroxiredoxin